jgi:hypothetical protein
MEVDLDFRRRLMLMGGSSRVAHGDRVMSTDIRGNTDETWLRGIRWLAKNRLLVDRLPE